jgi:hypothetical protein
MSDSQFLSKAEAEVVCRCSGATLQRYLREDKFPNSTKGGKGMPPRYAVADLVAAGLLDPFAATGPIDEIASRGRAERDLAATRTELAVASARIVELSAQIERADADIAFLRSLLATPAVA